MVFYPVQTGLSTCFLTITSGLKSTRIILWAEREGLEAEMKANIAAKGPITYANVDRMTEALTRDANRVARTEYGL